MKPMCRDSGVSRRLRHSCSGRLAHGQLRDVIKRTCDRWREISCRSGGDGRPMRNADSRLATDDGVTPFNMS